MEHAQRIAARSCPPRPRRIDPARCPRGRQRSRRGRSCADPGTGLRDASRFLGELRAVVRELADRPLSDASVEALLWVALYQLIHTSAPQHAVVDGAVRATAQRAKELRARTDQRDPAQLPARSRRSARDDREETTRPGSRIQRWWIDRVRDEYGERAAAILDNGNARPPLTLRVNRRALSRDRYVETLAAQGIAATAIGEAGVIVARPCAGVGLARATPKAGSWSRTPARNWPRRCSASKTECASSTSAQRPAARPTHLAELADARSHGARRRCRATRARRAESRAARPARAHRRRRCGGYRELVGWRRFDRILLDAPCTASGVVRRHPDGKWLRRESDLAAFAGQQQRLLDAVWPCLAPGGRLLYATCSIFRAENNEQVADFVARHDDVLRLPLRLPAGVHDDDGQLLPSGAGAEHNHDGFFYALLQKK